MFISVCKSFDLSLLSTHILNYIRLKIQLLLFYTLHTNILINRFSIVFGTHQQCIFFLFLLLLLLIETSKNPFKFLEKSIEIDGETYYYFDISHFKQLSKLPFSIRVLLESAIRNCDNFHINEGHVTTILNWVN